MALSQTSPVVPPLDSDKKLIDFASIIQKNLLTLFLSGHFHVGSNGILTSFPLSNQGATGDILIGVVNGTAYLFFKATSKDWYKIAATHV